jgi:hypothetical protein
MEQILQEIKAPIVATMGNHDTLEVAEALESLGIRILMNETLKATFHDKTIIIGGIDDAYYFKTHDLNAVQNGLEGNSPAILLSHSPQVVKEMKNGGYHFMLSGHTHGGQICFPNGKSILRLKYVPDFAFGGLWEFNGLKGYTSRGSGACHLPLRFNCPAEITLIELGYFPEMSASSSF